MPFTKRACRPSKHRSPSTANMITTGSVRGKCSRHRPGNRAASPRGCRASARHNWRRNDAAHASRAAPWPPRAVAHAPPRPCPAPRFSADRRREIVARLSASTALGSSRNRNGASRPTTRATWFHAGAERARLGQVTADRIDRHTLQHDQLAADHVSDGVGIAAKLFQRRVVAAQSGRAVDRARGVTERRRRTEIGARGHGQPSFWGHANRVRPEVAGPLARQSAMTRQLILASLRGFALRPSRPRIVGVVKLRPLPLRAEHALLGAVQAPTSQPRRARRACAGRGRG